ncbi:MAG: DHA2 family efflux MFS transporter permease subunit [Cyanobacteriota/Melainabacteria group bacterium]
MSAGAATTTTTTDTGTSVGTGSGRAGDSDAVPLKNWLAVIGASVGAFMAVLDIQITSSSLRDIQGGLAASVDEGSWISTSYLIAEIVTIPLSGWLSKVLSPRIYIVLNAALFVVFSMLCGMARDLPTMIAFRGLQGFTGGVLIPMCFWTILRMLPPAKQPIGLAIFSVSAVFAPSIGPAIGGYITDTFSWPYIFYLNLIPGVILTGMLLYSLPATKMNLAALKENDIPGIISMSLGLSALIYALEEGQRKDWFGSEEIRIAAAIAIVCLLFFLVRELVARYPLVNLRLFARRNFGIGTAGSVILGMALYGSVYLIPLYLAVVHEYSAWQIGQVMIWSGLPQLAITPFVPWVMKRVDPRYLIAFGLVLFSASCAVNAFMTHDFAGDQMVTSMLIRALGLPFIITPLSALATVGIEAEQAGSASSLFNMMRNLGGSIGTALASTLVVQREQFHSFRIHEHLSYSDPGVRAWLREAAGSLHHAGTMAWSAREQALAMLATRVRAEAYVMAFNDIFLCLAVLLAIGAVSVLFMKKPDQALGGAGAH